MAGILLFSFKLAVNSRANNGAHVMDNINDLSNKIILHIHTPHSQSLPHSPVCVGLNYKNSDSFLKCEFERN